MLDEMQTICKRNIIETFGKERAVSLGLLKADVRLDSREVRLEAEGTARDDNLRIRLDDDLKQERLDCEERIATQYLPTDSAKADALKKLARERPHKEWLEAFTRARLARENERRDSSSGDEDEALRKLNYRLANQWRENK